MGRTRDYFLAAAWLTSCCGSPALSQSVEEFYRGREVEFIVSGAAGTSFDTWARVMSKYLAASIPGRPTIVVKGMPGGGHIRAANYLFNVAPKDGSSIGIFANSVPAGFAMKDEAIKFDVPRFNWLGSPDQPNRICVAKQGAGVQRAEDLYRRELIVGGVGAASAPSETPTLLRNLLGMNFRIVDGYKGSTELMLAIDRGEIEGLCQTVSGIEQLRPGWMSDGRLIVLFNMERKPLAEFKAPTIYKYLKTEEEGSIVAFYNSSIEFGRPLAAPPGVPADRVNALRRAFDAAMADAEMIDAARKQGLEHSPFSGEELARRVDEIVRTPQHIIEKTRNLIRPAYGDTSAR